MVQVKDSGATIQDSGSYDLPAAIEHLLELTQASKVLLLGHSAGGQLLSIAHNQPKVAAVAGSSGYVKELPDKSCF